MCASKSIRVESRSIKRRAAPHKMCRTQPGCDILKDWCEHNQLTSWQSAYKFYSMALHARTPTDNLIETLVKKLLASILWSQIFYKLYLVWNYFNYRYIHTFLYLFFISFLFNVWFYLNIDQFYLKHIHITSLFTTFRRCSFVKKKITCKFKIKVSSWIRTREYI